ncbi:hypothetical protein [Reyranella sp.]|uniref:hypothetical protein n=1 Tax=Reyranella sp. TaxID=1929291 RepID=UPI003C7B49C1
MSITYPLALPSTRKWRSSNWASQDRTAEVASPFTGDGQAIVWPYQRWTPTLTLVSMKRADAQEWAAWLRSLRGRSGTFLLGDPARPAPLGAAAFNPGTPLVKGAGQSGGSLLIDGAPASVAAWLKRGDLIQLGAGATARLHEISEVVNTSGSGEAALSLWPALRESPADNSAIVLTNPVGVFNRTSDVVEVPTDTAGFYDLAFDCVDTLRG